MCLQKLFVLVSSVDIEGNTGYVENYNKLHHKDHFETPKTKLFLWLPLSRKNTSNQHNVELSLHINQADSTYYINIKQSNYALLYFLLQLFDDCMHKQK